MNAGDISSDLGCQHTVEGISLITSPVGRRQKGVYLQPKRRISALSALSIYPGVYKLMPVKFNFTDSRYAYCVTIQNRYPQGRNQLILDAFHQRHSVANGIGHLINSSHPQLPHPYDKPNCFLEEERPCDYDTSSRPPIVFIVSLIDIVDPCELLIDYHWRLNGIQSLLTRQILECSCIYCS